MNPKHPNQEIIRIGEGFPSNSTQFEEGRQFLHGSSEVARIKDTGQLVTVF
jgi:hypothetical protein